MNSQGNGSARPGRRRTSAVARRRADSAKASPAQRRVWIGISRRARLLLDLEAQARGATRPATSTTAALVEEALERLYGHHWPAVVHRAALTRTHVRRLRRDGRQQLRLTQRRLALLIDSLAQQTFRVAEVALRCGLARQAAHVAIRDLQARGLLSIRRLSRSHMSLWTVVRGPALDRWLAAPSSPAGERPKRSTRPRLA